MKIYTQKDGALTKGERIELATLLIKSGYTVRIGKMKLGTKSVEYVDYTTPTAKDADAAEDATQDAGTAAL